MILGFAGNSVDIRPMLGEAEGQHDMGDGKLDILVQVEEALRRAITLFDEHSLKGFADLHIQHAIDIIQDQMLILQPGAELG